MEQKTVLHNKWRENVFFVSLIVAASVFPFSEALVSISAGLLLFQSLAFQLSKNRNKELQYRSIILYPISIFGVYLIGTIFTLDFSFALYELKKVAFWLIIPLAFYLSPRLSDKRVYLVLLIFVISVTVASLFSVGKVVLNDYLQIGDFRSNSMVSHIRFSFQVILSLILVSWFALNSRKIPIKIHPLVFVGVFLWLGFFLFFLKSLLGILAFIGTLLVFLVFMVFYTKRRKLKLLLIALVLLVILIPSVFVANVVKGFYNFENIDASEVEKYTPSGNTYSHNFEDGTRENGHLVNVYVCEKELRQEWNKRSEIKYDDDLNGYMLGATLIRYLTSLGYRKDSVGMSKLTENDIQLVLEGVTNYKFKNYSFSIYPRIYETVWELDYYTRTGDPNEKTLAQRIEFVKASVVLIKENPLFGIGTGNWVKEYNEVYDRMETKLLPEKRGPSHNQYLNYLVKFGLIGFLWIIFAILYPVFRLGHRTNFTFILFLIAYAFANLGDANLESHMGLSFFVFFYSLFLWNSTSEMKKSIL
ncbi:O-Antigen ligase [Mariniphaga anaerophila]|uniref:O-Antigen ligase n=1 Tax=Mariniphaga anaerophila TaxID=1484053 RepID=A0A1M5G0F7_9BACT|nr:O-antigen ligase family protein [Mariniphaga anaerophila]SHF97199.1 O-Antigen ligase [Mariniphaga anaerophila]